MQSTAGTKSRNKSVFYVPLLQSLQALLNCDIVQKQVLHIGNDNVALDLWVYSVHVSR